MDSATLKRVGSLGNALQKSQFLAGAERQPGPFIGVTRSMEKVMIQTILAATILSFAALTLGSGPASAQMNYPWCSVTSGIGKECTHPSLGECKFDVSGLGGWCSRNSSYKSSENSAGHNQSASAAAQSE
jgi:hypothetical protein